MITKYIDQINSVIIIISCLLAHLFPYHLLLFSYAVLGPAHYLTQISWLHDRHYFSGSRFVAPLLVILSLLLLGIALFHGSHSALYVQVILSAAIGLAVMAIMPSGKAVFRYFTGIGMAVFIFTVLYVLGAWWWVIVLLPTIIHVFMFTTAFMLAGAMKTKKTNAYGAIAALWLSAMTFMVPGTEAVGVPSLQGVQFFEPIISCLQQILSLPKNTETSLFGFLSFAYTYHYLNWFSKVKVIQWHRIPIRRLMGMTGIYIIAIAAYWIDYAVGFVLMYWLSVMHVLLELPLDLRVFGVVGRPVWCAIKRQ